MLSSCIGQSVAVKGEKCNWAKLALAFYFFLLFILLHGFRDYCSNRNDWIIARLNSWILDKYFMVRRKWTQNCIIVVLNLPITLYFLQMLYSEKWCTSSVDAKKRYYIHKVILWKIILLSWSALFIFYNERLSHLTFLKHCRSIFTMFKIVF